MATAMFCICETFSASVIRVRNRERLATRGRNSGCVYDTNALAPRWFGVRRVLGG